MVGEVHEETLGGAIKLVGWAAHRPAEHAHSVRNVRPLRAAFVGAPPLPALAATRTRARMFCEKRAEHRRGKVCDVLSLCERDGGRIGGDVDV
eukprot:1992122-Pleurochrysis_carterae.AAC.8